MKTIRIYTATTGNGGRRLEAGERIGVGSAAGEISPARAKALVEDGSAVDASPVAKSSRKAVEPDHTSDEAE